MPYIIPNNVLLSADKVIKPYNCAIIAIEGPQIKGKLNLEGIEIPYDSEYTAMMTLNESAKDQPLFYGFLGTNITFLMIKANYMPNDPTWRLEETEYLEYYFGDDMSTKRYMGKLLLLTGNSLKRIPQIYLTNPSSTQKVYLEIMMANLPQSDISSSTLVEVEYISGLYYNNVLSNIINFTSNNSVGSTCLHITDPIGNVQLVIPYENINIIERTIDGSYTLIIGSDSEEKIKLEFLSDFDMKQAHSRISWVLKDTLNRYLTLISPPIDIESPVITWTESGSTSGYTILPWTSGSTITKTDLIDIFISGITDNRDGVIDISGTTVSIYRMGSLVPLTYIDSEGIYQIYFVISDIAGNVNAQYKYGLVDITPPTIYYYNYASGSTYYMSISGNTISETGITVEDIRLYTIDYVEDNIDLESYFECITGLTIYDVDITISGTTIISVSGLSYEIIYSLTDYAGNETIDYKTLISTS